MEKVKITDDYEEQVVIGKSIFENHPEEYAKYRVDAMYSDLSKILPEAEQHELDNAFYHSIYDYWVYGNNIREEFFYSFNEKKHSEKIQYITFRNRFNYYKFLNDKDAELLFKKKYETYKIFKDDYKRELIQIDGEEDFETFCEFVNRHNEFFVKPENSGLGVGVYKVCAKEWNSKRELFEYIYKENKALVPSSRSNSETIVLEEPIQQVDEMKKLHPSSVNIIRLSTILNNGEVQIVDAWLRIGMNGSQVTAAAIGEIYCGVNLESGCVETKGYTEFGDIYDRHPNTGIELIGYKVPNWKEMLKTAERLARMEPKVRYVGWDLALTKDGWVIVEGNENGEFLGQLIYGIPYKKKIEEMIGYPQNDKFWWEE